MIRSYVGSARWLTLRGIAALLFGLATLVWPGVTLWALVLLWGAYAFVDGVAALSAAIGDRFLRHRGWLALTGIAGIAAGVVTVVWPSMTALALLMVIAFWAYTVGVMQVATAIRMRRTLRHEWVLVLLGVLAIIFATTLVITPGSGAIAITWAIGWYALVAGVLLLDLAYDVHKETRGTETPRLRAPRTPQPA
jgi:uncharacterized membrane protein HdeD (DUF308 family)